jgi:protein tyrosine phosphatase
MVANKEEFKDTKGVIKIRKSKMDRQHNGQKKKYKRTNSDLSSNTHKTKDHDRINHVMKRFSDCISYSITRVH